jgi:hypothetical protein
LSLFVTNPVKTKCRELPKLDTKQELGVSSLDKILLDYGVVKKEVSKTEEIVGLRDSRVQAIAIIEVWEVSRKGGNQEKEDTSGLAS